MADRRRRTRKPAIELLASVRVGEYEREVEPLDYHARGMSFWWPAPLPEGASISLCLIFAGVRITDLGATVRSCRRMGHTHRCGVSFVIPPENELQTLRKLNAIEFRMAAAENTASNLSF